MISANLMPRSQRIALVRRDRARLWIRILTAYGAVLTAAWVTVTRLTPSAYADIARRTEVAKADAAATEQVVKKMRAEVSAVAAKLTIARSVGDNPDWTVLLGLLAGARGDELVLDGVDLQPAAVKGAKPGPSRPAAYSVRISGLGANHRAVTQFTLRLEATGLFERVALGDTRSVDRDGVTYVAFQIEAALTDTPKGAP